MGLKTPLTSSFKLPNGKEVIIETGKLATQAHGSVVVRIGDTMLFASVVSAHEPREGQSFFPLSVDYQEKFASVGRIPGNFFRREARLSDYEILTSRLVDRALRPLFPDGYMNDTQIIINLISSDNETMPDAYAALAASAALAVSDIPFAGPLSEVRVSKINGEYVVNPNRTEFADATLDIIIAATLENVMMVEGEAKECSEQELIEAIKVGHEAIKVQCNAQLALAEKVGEKATVKRDIVVEELDAELESYVRGQVSTKINEVAKAALGKFDRKDRLSAIKDDMLVALEEKYGEEFTSDIKTEAKTHYKNIEKELIREMVMAEKIRLDGRKPNEVRPIWSEIGYLPAAHGSAIFNRGETQSLTSLTLGTKLDKQMIDVASGLYFEKFILHYNFPALSVGETRPMRGPGRREVGHANLAHRALSQVLPEDNPYTIRLVSDILESNGSSSMATVCAGSLALMDAGIKVTAPVSGIAMGMISDGKRNIILTDILGDEDHIGDMDFKVTGTANGITACQMDIKIDGLPYEILEEALNQAKEGRLHILGEMNKTISTPNSDLKEHAPRIIELKIDKSFIGAVIGPGGKIIQDIQEKSGAVVNIEEDGDFGIVSISSSNKTALDMAKARVEDICFMPKVGDIYDAVAVSLMPYGVFVDFKGKSGLVHISELEHRRLEKVEEAVKEGDKFKVKIIGIDERSGKMKLSRKALMARPEKKA